MADYKITDKWHGNNRITIWMWSDKWIEFRVEYFAPGQSIHKPPAREIMAMLANDKHTEHAIENRLDSVVAHVLHNNGKLQTEDERFALYQIARGL